jgi:hypothetical protein
MNQQFYQNMTDYVTAINRVNMEAAAQTVKATQEFALEAWKLHPLHDVFESNTSKKTSK